MLLSSRIYVGVKELYRDRKWLLRGTSDQRGIRQGCFLSHCFFYVCTEVTFRRITHVEGINRGGVNINNVRYADGTILL